jgi:hypothetical protein
VRSFIGALALVGCSSSGNQAHPSTCTPPACPLATLMLAAEVAPPADTRSIYADADLPTVAFDETGVLKVVLEPLVHITGVVHIGSSTSTTLLTSGTVLASRPSRISGRPDRTYQAIIDPQSGRYALAVSASLPNEQYTLRIVGSDPSQFAPQTFQVAADSDTLFDVFVDDPNSLINVQGTITDATMPVGGMLVQAIDPATQTPVSTVATSDATTGAYSIRLSSTVLKLASPVLAIVATPTAGTQPILSDTKDVSAGINGSPYSLDLHVPAMPTPSSYRYPIHGTSSSGADVAIVGASCHFEASVSGTGTTTAKIVADAQTDAEGYVTVDLRGNRTYALSIAPPADSDFASTGKTPLMISVGMTGGVGQTVMLPLRPRLVGQLISLNGGAAASVTVEPGPASVAANSADSLAQVNKLGTAQSDASGRFALRLDAGSYDVALVPSATSLLPRRWLPRTQVSADTDLGDVVLPNGTIARVTVSDSGGNPLASSSVQLYSVDAANAACSPTMTGYLDCLAPPRLMAQGTTSGTGALPVLLPSQN